jgi:hypothetical protein
MVFTYWLGRPGTRTVVRPLEYFTWRFLADSGRTATKGYPPI